MTDTADPTTLSVDERTASARSFFDVGPAAPDVFPPPHPASRTATLPVAAPEPSVPQLPRVLPTVASQPSVTPFAFSPESVAAGPSGAKSGHKKGSRGRARRTISWLLVLAVIGAGVYAGITYGPGLMHRDESDPTASEPEAPLAFPPVVPAATPARTATFVVERSAEDGTAVHYEVTNDSETGITRMLIDRATMPDIEVLAVFDIANLHQIDQTNWWSIPRGQFPFADPTDRQRWLRTVDEYFPAPMRQFVSIQHASEAVLGNEPMRHLVVIVDGGAVAQLATDPLTGQPIPPQTLGEFVVPPAMAGSPETIEPITIEMWVDSNGVIRKLVEPEEMGGQTITVSTLSPDAFSPTFPAPEVVAPMTAEQLAEFAS